jgi:uncharacterized protein (TIGR03083 family)
MSAGTFATMVAELDYVEHIRRESDRFGACFASAHRSDRVPSCPDWTADDLLWHLTEVQLFWGAIVRDRLDDPDAAEAAKPERPGDLQALLSLFEHATAALIDAFATTPGETEVWTWSPDHSVNFVRRRQAHEALIHRLDAELVIGDLTDIDPDLAFDGVDEVLAIVHGDLPPWATFSPDGTTGLVEAQGTGRAWSLTFGRFSGTSPNTGKTYDMDTFIVVDRAEHVPSFTVRGSAGDLDAWLWGRRPVDRLAVDGDRDAFTRLEQIVSRGVD